MNDTTHGQVWDLIPWYVNQTLDAETYATVSAHISDCALCRAEVVAQERVAAILVEDTALEQSAWANWDGVAARLDGPVTPRPGALTRLADWVGSYLGSVPAMVLAGAAAVVVVGVASWQGPTVYRTLTTPPALAVETELRLRAQPGVDHDALLGDLEALGLEVLSGETQNSLIRAIPPTDNAARAAALEALRSDPRIAFMAGADE